jgi:hypothetical protein
MKKEMVEYVVKCSVCQQVKMKHKKPTGPLKLLLIPEWKWEDIIMDFMSDPPREKI